MPRPARSGPSPSDIARAAPERCFGLVSSVRARLLLLVLLAMLPALAFILYTAREHRQMAAAEARGDALRVARLAALEQHQVIESGRQLLAALAELPALRALEPAAGSAVLAGVLSQLPAYTNLVATTPDGIVVCSGTPMAGPVSLGDRPHFRRAVRSGRFTMSGYLVGRVTGLPQIALAYPVVDGSGSVRAVVGAALDLRWLEKLATEAELPSGSTVAVVDGDGLVLARHPTRSDVIGRHLGEPVFATMRAWGEGTAETGGLDGVPMLFGFTRLPLSPEAGNAYVVVGIPRTMAFAGAHRILVQNLLGFGLAVLLVLLIAVVGGERLVARRARSLAEAARRLSAGDLEVRTGLPHDRSELGQVARAFDEMVQSVDRLTRLNRLILRSTAEAIFGLDVEGRVTFVNPAAAAMCGVGADEAIGRSIHAVLHGAAPESLLHAPEHCPLQRALGGSAAATIGEDVAWRVDGTSYPVEYSLTPIQEDGEFRGATAVLRDISDRRQREEQLRRANRALRVLGTANQALIRAETEAELLGEVCRALVEIGEYRLAWVGLGEGDDTSSIRVAAHAGVDEGYLASLQLSWTHDGPGCGPMAMALQTHEPQILKDIRTSAPGLGSRREALRRGYASLIVLPLIAGGRVLGAAAIYAPQVDAFDAEEVDLLVELAGDLAFGVASLRARAEHARAQEALQRQRDLLYQTEKVAALGQLLAGVAHELNNPLSIVLGQASLLEAAAGDSPVAARAKKIAHASERCARIVKNFLGLARQRPPERDHVDLNAVIHQALELLAYQLKVDDVVVSLDLAPDLPKLWADPHQLSQVVVNLMTNAHHAMRETPPPRRLSIATAFDPEGRCVVLRVTDTGPGIPPTVHMRLFEPFFTTKPVGQGTGLGLSLCRGIIEGHGGTIRADWQPAPGAAFVVELPVGELGAAGDAGNAAAVSPPLRGKRVLVVDDEPEIRELLVEILAAEGHDLDVAADGAAALEAARVGQYDVIITDVKMPQLDGMQLHRVLEQEQPRLARRMVFLTGDILGPDIAAFLERTGARSVSKPFLPEDIHEVVQEVLRGEAEG